MAFQQPSALYDAPYTQTSTLPLTLRVSCPRIMHTETYIHIYHDIGRAGAIGAPVETTMASCLAQMIRLLKLTTLTRKKAQTTCRILSSYLGLCWLYGRSESHPPPPPPPPM